MSSACARLWSNLNERRFISHAIYRADVPEDVHRMIAFFVSLRPANDEQRQYLASARDILGTIVETQVTMIRSLVNQVPFLLLVVVLGWSYVLFFGYGLLSDIDALTIVLAAVGGDLRRERGARDPRITPPRTSTLMLGLEQNASLICAFTTDRSALARRTSAH